MNDIYVTIMCLGILVITTISAIGVALLIALVDTLIDKESAKEDNKLP